VRGYRKVLRALSIAMLATATVTSLLDAPAFADVSPVGRAGASAKADDSRIELAQANLPPIGSVDDYVREGNDQDGGPTAGAPPQAYQQYQPQAAPAQGYYPQGAAPQEFNNSYPDPNADRSALIGAAIVGAVAVGMWAWQQHEIHQAERRANR